METLRFISEFTALGEGDFSKSSSTKYQFTFKSDDETKEDLCEKILNRYLNDMVMYKVILKGKRNFEIDTRELLRVLSHENILKIKDETKIAINLEDLARQNNLKGFLYGVCSTIGYVLFCYFLYFILKEYFVKMVVCVFEK